jgi:hypothetical protein
MKKYKINYSSKTIENTSFDAEYCEAENKTEAIKKAKLRLSSWDNLKVSKYNFTASEVTEMDTLTIGYINQFGN